MATDAIAKLPEGFVLDGQMPQQPQLPEGFVLDAAQQPQPIGHDALTEDQGNIALNIGAGLLRGTQQLGLGGIQLANKVLETGANLIGANESAQLFSQQNQQMQQDAQRLEKNDLTPTSNSLAAVAPEIATFAKAPFQKIAQRALAGGAIGALQGEKEDGERLKNIAFGAGGAAVLPPAIGYIGGKIGQAGGYVGGKLGVGGKNAMHETADTVKQVFENEAPNIRNAFSVASETGEPFLDFAKLPDRVKVLLNTTNLKNLSPIEQERVMNYAALGIKDVTLPNITRNYADDVATRNLMQNAAAGTPLREKGLAQNQQLIDAAQRAVKMIDGEAKDSYGAGENLVKTLNDAYDLHNTKIQNVYKQADQIAGNLPSITTNIIKDTLKDSRANFLSSDSGKNLLNGIRARLQDFTQNVKPKAPNEVILVNADGTPLLMSHDIPEKMTFTDSENFRKYLNSISTYENNGLVKKVKQAVDAAQESVTGNHPVYQKARALRRERSTIFEDQNGLAQLMAMKTPNNEAIPVDNILDRLVFNKGDAKSLQQVTDTLRDMQKSNGNLAGQAGDSLRILQASTLQKAIDASIGSTPNSAGQGTFSGLQFGRQLDKIGQRKLEALFNKQQLAYLGTLKRGAIDLTTSPTITNGHNASGTSAQVMNMLEMLAPSAKTGGLTSKAVGMALDRVPVVGAAINKMGRDAILEKAAKKQAEAAADPVSAIFGKDNTKAKALAKLIKQNSVVPSAQLPQNRGQ